MLRKLIPIILFLFTLIFFILLFQWNNYQAFDYQSQPLPLISQKFDIHHQNNSLKVTQQWENLPEETYEAIFPVEGTNFQCKNEPDSACNTTLKTKNGKLTIEYVVPIDEREQYFYVQDWYVKLADVSIQKTSFQISEQIAKAGYWGLNAKTVTNAKYDYLNFSSFEKYGGASPLYWQVSELAYHNHSGIHIYGEAKNNQIETIIKWLKANQPMSDKLPAIIFSTEGVRKNVDELVIVPTNIKKDELFNEWLNQYLRANILQFTNKELWQIPILTSLYHQPLNLTAKQQEMYDQLQKNFTEQELQQVKKEILQKPVTLKEVDAILSKVKNAKTNYLSQNRNEQQPVIPLVFKSNKNLIVNGEVIKNAAIYIESNQVYLPFQLTMERLNYQFNRISDNEVYVAKQGEVYRFYYDKNVFLFNEEEYGLFMEKPSTPFKKIDGTYYIQHSLLLDIFKINIRELPNGVDVTL